MPPNPIEPGADQPAGDSTSRGQAYFEPDPDAKPAGEFQKILDHRGVDPLSVLYPLSQLGLARAHVLSGDVPKARKSYQDFFATWNDADPDLPILVQARQEYAGLE